ncbi:terminase [Salmonella enterica subsp. enterica serovar Weltevreden]|uniref:phage terminase small subunit n=1 Tax=Salmonella enterica TaxID=28901 RepID=UPI00070F84A0|nr:terminase endonuclease subunit [Salmonella enterica]EAA6601831.1 terminase [Salmonella enterica subsp. enterica]EBR8157570.1 terminase [Salmonella enterica subsp. enterica serovar Newport]EBS5954583.1 terminase [Salmonella enterica subsp. enterica serovar Uganda]ECI2580247.1 terminase [Salmonella enterica subsp. enterica serovar Liverpool]EDT9765720.1 terminase endonuclease subunit [Salmonella enterica subsp. enterica serovar Falkensee]EEA8066242.1 terminase endonuclease subunit [Salmonell
MTSPAQRHMMRVSASQAAQREQAPLRHATAYEQMLVKLADDRRTLKNIRSNERKAEKKRELLQFYAPWVAGVLTDGRGAQDDIVMTVMLWRLDAGDIAGALEIAPYALKYGLTSDHRRTTPYMLVEEVALAALRLRDAGESVDLSWLQTTIDLTDGADVPDMVRARLHKVTGLTLRDVGMNAEALAQFQRAMQLDRNAGVRKEIERLERALKPKAEAPPRKTTKPRTRKPVARPAAKRGRPPKAVKTAG